MSKIQIADEKGRIFLGKEWANKDVTIEEIDTGIFIVKLVEWKS